MTQSTRSPNAPRYGTPNKLCNMIGKLMELEMSRYWKPTRSQYFDHVTKARIIDVVANAVSPKAAADLPAMKKSDAAAAAELRLAQTRWLPEILTHRKVLAVDEGDFEEHEDGDDTGGTPSHAEELDSALGDSAPTPAALPAWPFPKAKPLIEHRPMQ